MRFNPAEGKADEEFNELFVVALKWIAGCSFVTLLLLAKSNLEKLPYVSSVVWLQLSIFAMVTLPIVIKSNSWIVGSVLFFGANLVVCCY